MKTYSTFNLWIRSSIFFLFSTLAIILFSPMVVLCFFLPLNKRFALVKFFLGIYFWVLRKVCHIDYQVEGLEHFSKVKVGIIFSKHQSLWETFFLPYILKDPAIIIKRELLWIPFFGWGLAMLKPISINRNNRSSAMQQIITQGQQCLQAGRWLLIFPEGTRIPYGKIGHYKLGGARLAAATGYPVIPIALNAGYFWPKRKFIKRPGTIRVIIGPPISTQDRTPEVILEDAKAWIESTALSIAGLVNKPAG